MTSGWVDTGFQDYRFLHVALPEIRLDEVSLEVEFLGKRLAAPLLVSSMTGGTSEAQQVNRTLAGAAQELGLAFALGSARVALESPDLARTFQVREIAPDALLLANLGAVQLNCGYGYDECMRILEFTGADALNLHLNPLQEALQPGGDTDFRNLLEKIAQLAQRLPVPVVVKEVGWGISGAVARRLVDCGVAAIDVAGAGGTSWSEVERLRIEDEALRKVAQDFRQWGIPTAECIVKVRQACPEIPLVGSGGLRSGIDLAKAIALGADLGGAALPFLKAACDSEQSLRSELRRFVEGLRIAMFCIGARTVKELRGTPSLQRLGACLEEQQ